MNLDQKKEKATELGMEITEETTEAEIDAFIKDKTPKPPRGGAAGSVPKKNVKAKITEELKILRGKARRLKVLFDDTTSEEDLQTLIAEAEERKEAEKRQLEIMKSNEKLAKSERLKANIILRNTDLVDMEQEDYFTPEIVDGKVNKDTAPYAFNRMCGYPVEREELIEVFDSIFPKSQNFLFYKSSDKEVYLIIVPLKYAATVQPGTEPTGGSFQRHALSFIGEGSVNIESLRSKLKAVYNHSEILKQAIA